MCVGDGDLCLNPPGENVDGRGVGCGGRGVGWACGVGGSQLLLGDVVVRGRFVCGRGRGGSRCGGCWGRAGSRCGVRWGGGGMVSDMGSAGGRGVLDAGITPPQTLAWRIPHSPPQIPASGPPPLLSTLTLPPSPSRPRWGGGCDINSEIIFKTPVLSHNYREGRCVY